MTHGGVIWAGTVSYFNGKYWSRDQPVTVLGSTYAIAAHRAVAEIRRPRGARVTGIMLRLDRVGPQTRVEAQVEAAVQAEEQQQEGTTSE